MWLLSFFGYTKAGFGDAFSRKRGYSLSAYSSMLSLLSITILYGLTTLLIWLILTGSLNPSYPSFSSVTITI